MQHTTHSENSEIQKTPQGKQDKKGFLISASILFVVIAIFVGVWVSTGTPIFSFMMSQKPFSEDSEVISDSAFFEEILPSEGVALPVRWGDLGARLVGTGVIDGERFKALYESRGEFTDQYAELLFRQYKDTLVIDSANAPYLLNLFWALGLASKNSILDYGEMMDSRYGGAGNFASTAGWTLAKGDPMSHYSRHDFFSLTSEQQALVDKVSRGIYRPCCNNSTHFPDCNHGMAMLGLLELMASQGVSEEDMWKTALAVNSFWFPDTYVTIATFMRDRGIRWEDVNPEEVLGSNYSSASGYRRVASQVVQPTEQRGGLGCAVDAGGLSLPQQRPVFPNPQQRRQGGCGI